jgi:transposase InsO family protein
MIQQKEIPIVYACSALKLSRSNFYSQTGKEKQEDLDKYLRKEIEGIALEFPFYGYRRVSKELRRRDLLVNHKKVLRLMRKDNLLCRRKKAFKPVTTNSNHNYNIYQNLIKDIEVTGLNQVWVGDITYVQMLQGFVYLAAIIDIFSRKCIGWALERSLDAGLALGALTMAIRNRRHLGLQNLIHHSDRGVQYASNEYVEMLEKHRIKISMSRSGNPYDNAFAESFNKTLKVEEVYINEYESFEEAYKNIQKFIEQVYNKKRLHSSIGYVPPEEFERRTLKKAKL